MAWVTMVGRTTVGDCTAIPLPDPAFDSGGFTISTLVNSGRNANGDFVGQLIGADKVKIEMSWNVLTPAQFKTLLKVFDRSSGQGGHFVNWFTILDPRTRTTTNLRMYVGDRQGKPMMVSASGPKYWTDIQANLIEV